MKTVSLKWWLGCCVLLFFSVSWKSPKGTQKNTDTRTNSIALCGSWGAADTAYAATPLYDGLGDWHFAVSTNNPEAQKYFDQGLRLVYAFNHLEALRSFQEAARLDPGCPMAQWGQALALGPNLNDWNPRDREKMALEAVQRAKQRQRFATQMETDFINAMSARFNGKDYPARDSLNSTYVKAMGQLAKKYPKNADALTLYADAMMTSIAWDYWERDGSPKKLTSEIVKVITGTISSFPKHPGAHHLYVHLVEASSNPGVALPSAAFLETAMPSAGHLVHMPAHIYARVGFFDKSIQSNVQAIEADEKIMALRDDPGTYRMVYYNHNIDFIGFSAYMSGQREKALQSTGKLVMRIQGLENVYPLFYDYYQPEPLNAYIRFGQWKDILSQPSPTPGRLQPALMTHFARGMALLNTGRLKEARMELASLESLQKMDTLKKVYVFFNSLEQIANVAVPLLRGEILRTEKNPAAAISNLEQAATAEDELRYNEPPDWRLPVRHYLGAALLEVGKYKEAETVYLQDLKYNPENGWALQGLWQSQSTLKKDESAKTLERFNLAWKHADVKIKASRF